MNDLYSKRLEKVLAQMEIAKLEGLIVSDPYSIWYLSGIWNDPFERMYVLYIPKSGRPKLYVNKLFNVPKNNFEEFWFSDTDDYVGILAQGIPESGKIGVDKIWPAKFLLPLMQKKSKVNFELGSACIDYARGIKDSEEIRLMKEASRINDLCIEKGMAFVKEGISEKEVAAYIDSEFLKAGAQGNSFTTIVSFGANAADPHHEPDDTVVKEGDCVLIDMGCKKDRYCSDMTRTNFFKTAPEDFKKIHEIVRMANKKAEDLIKPGVRLCDIDAAARNYISDCGYGQYFTHRLGHFIGQTDHEAGDVSSTNTQPVQEGMIFSIEPGIYIPGKIGVRIEDLVLVTKDGVEILNQVDKNWKIVG
ncbi:MAG: Xaa-Pro peptidase family protein [Treponema sp.]|nr:Xaa-Pro peptidase family protein [Treponema sp.]